MKVNNSVAIKAGEHEGLAGIIDRVTLVEGEPHYLVSISGVKDGEPVQVQAWFEAEQLEVI